jgi:GTP pyrophosphokinase
MPKENGYQSIQTTLNWTREVTAEVQIRTFEMHEFNEFGPASHIAYKYGQKQGGVGYKWVKDLVGWQKSDKGIKNYRIKVLTDFIYVFTPKGDTLQLPKGASGLDFAYRVHTRLGNCCNGIKINGKIAKMGTELKTGDMVEVLTCKKVNANESWLDLVKTASPRDRIRQAIIKENDRMRHE